MATALALCALAACDTSEVLPPPPHRDAGPHPGRGHHDGGTRDASMSKDAGPGKMTRDAMIQPTLPFPDPVCSLKVGAECDGAEDCDPDEVCCGELAAAVPTYESITCQKTCEAPMSYELCHPGDSCRDGSTCRRSSLIPHDFIGVCITNNLPTPGGDLHGKAISGKVVCGDTTCRANVEKCCLRAEVTFGTGPMPLPTYCAPLSAACDCSDEVPPGSNASENDGG